MITIPKPGFDRVLIVADPAKDQSPGGILLPNAKPDLKGTVVAIGEGKVLPSGVIQPMSWKPGDRVLYSEYNTVEVVVGGVKLLSMREENIIMAVEIVENDSDEAVAWLALIEAAKVVADVEARVGG